MKRSHILAFALGTAVSTGTAFAASGSDADRQSFRADNWLTIPAVYERVTAAGYRDINEIEREKRGYEIKAVSPRGERVKLYVDPINGEVLDVRSKRDKHAQRRQWEAQQAGSDDRMGGHGGKYRENRADR